MSELQWTDLNSLDCLIVNSTGLFECTRHWIFDCIKRWTVYTSGLFHCIHHCLQFRNLLNWLSRLKWKGEKMIVKSFLSCISWDKHVKICEHLTLRAIWRLIWGFRSLVNEKIFLKITPFWWVVRYRLFGGAVCLHLHGNARKVYIILKTEAEFAPKYR